MHIVENIPERHENGGIPVNSRLLFEPGAQCSRVAHSAGQIRIYRFSSMQPEREFRRRLEQPWKARLDFDDDVAGRGERLI